MEHPVSILGELNRFLLRSSPMLFFIWTMLPLPCVLRRDVSHKIPEQVSFLKLFMFEGLHKASLALPFPGLSKILLGIARRSLGYASQFWGALNVCIQVIWWAAWLVKSWFSKEGKTNLHYKRVTLSCLIEDACLLFERKTFGNFSWSLFVDNSTNLFETWSASLNWQLKLAY